MKPVGPEQIQDTHEHDYISLSVSNLKKYKQMKKILLIIAVGLGIISCEQDDYLVDGGLSDGHVRTTTFDFLKSHDQLDTLALLIERGGFVEEVNGVSTLFAPNDLSIKNYVNKVLAEMRQIDPEAEFTVDDIPVDTLTKYLGGYIFTDRIRREDMVKEGRIYSAINGEERRLSLEPTQEYTDQLSEYPEYVYYTYKGGSDWDDWNNITDDTKIVVRTSNLISTNGIIHVLQGSHTLFNYKD
ncbi:MAG: fasciclin domain-containing protein [Cytophagales bacterium]|nr:fasciclin domain-containing protein [Cytophagales bacterium]